ncbi:chemotaxis protein CheX [Pontibacillus marinus]|uniref:Chemotaxis protein CheX n=1 Tax=Pontibacillus marinus BH030004 = DSM 16465 TaxID=1385511 RepID=A0A0A5FWR5_9BACI|nr:chemotaxis protein CheX [Pontibacillus marinus]KGX83468.1 chemotaxis protein CheX [Pontibacillus marinus BH030004 = DSM 16465]
MTVSQGITEVLNGTIESVKSIIPFDVNIDSPSLIEAPLIQAELGVLIGMTGDMKGRLVIEGNHKSIGSIGEKMFGMPVEGEMLESFTGELANMIAGNLATVVSQREVSIDITPPTVIVGSTKISGFKKAFRVPVELSEEESLQLILMVED